MMMMMVIECDVRLHVTTDRQPAVTAPHIASPARIRQLCHDQTSTDTEHGAGEDNNCCLLGGKNPLEYVNYTTAGRTWKG